MNEKIFKMIESIVAMLVGVLIVSYTQDILISIVYIIPIGIAYSLLSKFLKGRKKVN